MPIALRARLVIPVDRPPIAGGVVTIDGERIVAIEPAAKAGTPVQDLGDLALLPALVNAHSHLEFSHLQKPLGRSGMRLVEWLPLAIAERQNRGHSAAEAIAEGLKECAAAGTSAVGEIATADWAEYSTDRDVAIAPFLEIIGFSRARAETAFAAALERLDSAKFDLVGLSPHAPYTVSPELLSNVVRLAEGRGLPVAMHLAESEEELALLDHGTGPFRDLLDARSMWDPAAISPGSRPLDYLQLLAKAPRSLVIHGNYLDRAEREFLAANRDRMSLVYCPRTHEYFDHRPYPLAELLAAGVHVALGTDSRASNPDLNMLAEIRAAAKHHPQVAPEAILKMGTLAAAHALGLDADYGSITPGKFADLIAVPTRTGSLAEVLAATEQPSASWRRGEVS